MTVRLIIGGARSGKSTYAESLVADAPAVTYVATSARDASDVEWEARVAAHVARRPLSWETVETLDVAALLRTPGPVALIDCVTLWLTRQLDAAGAWAEAPGWEARVGAAIDDLVDAAAHAARDAILVTNEVGQGVVPASASGRLFRDQMGVVNLRLAQVCDEAWWVVAGRPLRLG